MAKPNNTPSTVQSPLQWSPWSHYQWSLIHATILRWILPKQVTSPLQAKFGESHDPYADSSIPPRKGVHLNTLYASFSNFQQQSSCIKNLKHKEVPPWKNTLQWSLPYKAHMEELAIRKPSKVYIRDILVISAMCWESVQLCRPSTSQTLPPYVWLAC